MGLLRLRPGLRKVGYYILGFWLFYFFFLKETRVSETFRFKVKNIQPQNVWEFWADFSNYRKINPTILDFDIGGEHGDFSNWQYKVTYTEKLTLIPFQVLIHAKYIVTPEQKFGHSIKPYRIVSEHDTCFWIFCTHTDADMTFTSAGKDTEITETLHLGCPPLLKWYYLKEARTQRQYIEEELQNVDFSDVSGEK